MKRGKKVVVLMGGKTPEYEISLISGKEVVRNLPKRYKAFPVVVSRDGNKWQLTDKKTLLSLPDPLALRGIKKDITIPKKNLQIVQRQNLVKSADVVFIAMHGPFGEDGTVQGMLELAGIPYTGPGVLASALGMDKIMFRKVLEAENIPVPKYVVLQKSDPVSKVAKKLSKPPYFVKPSNQGSSVGASIAKSNVELKNSLKEAFKYSKSVLVDEYIKGCEITCGVIGNDAPEALPLVEIIPLKGEFFDYESKYTESGAEEIVPAKISKKLTKDIQKISLDVYKAVGCQGFSRIDFILKNNTKPLVLEINTIPGLTPMSLLPKAAKAAGYSYPKFLNKIINYAYGEEQN